MARSKEELLLDRIVELFDKIKKDDPNNYQYLFMREMQHFKEEIDKYAAQDASKGSLGAIHAKGYLKQIQERIENNNKVGLANIPDRWRKERTPPTVEKTSTIPSFLPHFSAAKKLAQTQMIKAKERVIKKVKNIKKPK